MKFKRLWAIPVLLTVAAFLMGATVMGIQQFPRGVSAPYWYGYSSGAPASYYLAAPTLSANDTAAGIAATQTLTNKTLTSPVISNLTASRPVLSSSGKVLTSADYNLSGTSGQTYTFPTTTATLARTDAANTFSGTQTFAGSLVATNIDTALSSTTVALNADGNTTLYTVPVGKRAVLTKAILIAGADAGSTDFTIGQAGALTDFLGTQQCDNLNAANDAAIFMPVPNATAAGIKSYAAGTVIKMVVANQAGGATNTLVLFGFTY